LPDDPFPGLLSALLLVLAASFGGLRTLLASPNLALITAGLPKTWQDRADRAAASPRRLTTSAGLLRLICLIAAIVLLLNLVDGKSQIFRWLLLFSAAVFSGILLEGVPALIQRGRGRKLVLCLLPVLQIGAIALSPFTLLIQRVLSWFEVPQGHERTRHLAAELTEVAHQHARTDSLGPAERKMIGHLLQLPETDAAEVMTPRTGLTAIPFDATVANALELAESEGHSRIPVFEEDFDHIKGVFHIKDVLPAFAQGSSIADDLVSQHMKEAYFVPETVRLPNLFEDMRRRRVHLAVVVDEYGGTAGVVTIEDLLEEIVGEIEDEHDSMEDQPKIHASSSDEIVADGSVSIDLLNEEFSADLPEDESYETLAGLIFERLGHVPSTGEFLQLDHGILEVLEADDRRIHKVKFVRNGGLKEPDAA
jgi:CBS domain containing-hemolysin-like protein